MSKLQSIVDNLSRENYEAIFEELSSNNAEKSAHLLQLMRDGKCSQEDAKKILGVNNNAYYTLRSRLNDKIEEFMLREMETPRTELLRRVAGINEIVFTQKRTVAIATLKKLEKELLDYDLPGELTTVYKNLKKLHLNTSEQFTYSQLYNNQIAYTFAIDKVENLIAEYFRNYGIFYINNETNRVNELEIAKEECEHMSGLYDSHRLYVLKSCVSIFHRLFVNQEQEPGEESFEDAFRKIENIFESYYLDSLYYHLRMVFEFLRLMYYNQHDLYKKAEKHYVELNQYASLFLGNYYLHTFPAFFLFSKMDKYLREGREKELYTENKSLFVDYENDKVDLPRFVVFSVYRALSCYYAGNYKEANQWLAHIFNEVTLKDYQHAQVEIKCLVALNCFLLGDKKKMEQNLNSVRRRIKALGKENYYHVIYFTRMMKYLVREEKGKRSKKLKKYFDFIADNTFPAFSVVKYIIRDSELEEKLNP